MAEENISQEFRLRNIDELVIIIEHFRGTQVVVFTCFEGMRGKSRELFTDNLRCVRLIL